MTIIFDENVPWPLSWHLDSYSVSSVQKEGWAGIQNGALIQKVDGLFDILLLAEVREADDRSRTHKSLKNPPNNFANPVTTPR